MGSSNAYWLIPDHVVFVHNVGDLNGADFREVDGQIIALLNEAASKHSEKVHIFIDSTELTKLPNVLELEGGRILKYLREANTGWSIVVGHKNNVFLKVISRLLTSMTKSDLYVADDLAKGASFIRQIAPDLDVPNVQEWKTYILSEKTG
ncbi:MAG: hypothetical protein RLP44_28165 [Aggregatilineales bacterium]